MTLATLADVKQARGIDPSNTRRDGFLQSMVDAANEWVSDHTGLSAQVGTHVDVLEYIQLGTTVTLPHRPIDQITLTEAWIPSGIWTSIGAWSDSGWTAISAVVEDAEKGLVQFPIDIWNVQADPYGLSGLFTPAPWFNWRSTVLPAVRITYSTLIGQVPSRVRAAAIALAIYWSGRVQAGAATDMQVGRFFLREQYMTKDIPDWIISMLAPYIAPSKVLWA